MQTVVITATVQLPPPPTHLVLADGLHLPLSALTEDGAREIGEAYAEQLIEAGRSPAVAKPETIAQAVQLGSPDKHAPPWCWPPRMEKVLGTEGQHLATLLPDYGLMFDATGPRMATSHAKARVLASEVQLLGFNDWRLPESHELQLLIRHDRHQPAIDTEFFPITPTNDWYWTNTEHASDSSCAWGVLFSHGGVGCDDRSGSGFVRAVRRVPASQ